MCPDQHKIKTFCVIGIDVIAFATTIESDKWSDTDY